MKKKKKSDLIKHAILRYKERYLLDIDKDNIEKWNGDIRRNRDNVSLINRQSNTRSLYLINNKIYAIYNHNLKCICTFLTKEMINNDYIYTGRGF